MRTNSIHLLVEYFDCDRTLLDDVAQVEAALCRAADAAGATVMDIALHRFAPQGVSGVVVIAESHLSIHTWPEYGYAAVDVYTCGECDPLLAHEVLLAALRAGRAELMTVERGLDLSGRGHAMKVTRHRSERPPQPAPDDDDVATGADPRAR
ncbi:adenosylmethionine decarboxylase [Haliangium sp.]|uniref:adenosylmethionine decarboxylase n=1 Tax=Haliangium sp. TaxID=2663208 RepID=UPI003D1508B5